MKGALVLTAALVAVPNAHASDATMLHKIHKRVHRVHHIQRALDVTPTPYHWYAEKHPYHGPMRYALRLWGNRVVYWKHRWKTRPRWSVDWNAIARCESTGRWDLVTTGNGFWFALQFVAGTWTRNGGPAWYITHGVAPPKSVQIRVAEHTLKHEGLDSWPKCGADG